MDRKKKRERGVGKVEGGEERGKDREHKLKQM